ncbi:hypothetical protein ACGFSI_34990 [Streptomyces virginiae]|uniref:hypothetical protein n=1 Tax=Streptomyces virginiae TaxID=1961 RepID=UPI0037120397
MFAPLVRRDRRAKGSLHLRGPLLDGRGKPLQPMAERLGMDHQLLPAGVPGFEPVGATADAAARHREAGGPL